MGLAGGKDNFCLLFDAFLYYLIFLILCEYKTFKIINILETDKERGGIKKKEKRDPLVERLWFVLTQDCLVLAALMKAL